MPEVLPVGYYLDHFETLLSVVETSAADLLNPDERDFLANFRARSLSARRLFVRLVSRQGPAFRLDRLQYPEIPDLPRAVVELEGAGLIARNPDDHAEAAMRLLSAVELAELATALGVGLAAGCRKSERQEALWRTVTWLGRARLLEAIRRRFDWVVPLHLPTLRWLRLLFFGVPDADLSAFVLSDLGRRRFETYQLSASHRWFADRDQAQRALLIADLREQLEVAVAAEEGEDVARLVGMLPAAGDHPALLRRRRRFLEVAGRFWERHGQIDRAIAVYSDAETRPARDRLARLLAKSASVPSRGAKPAAGAAMPGGNVTPTASCDSAARAVALCREILVTPRNAGEETAARSILRRIIPDDEAPLPPIASDRMGLPPSVGEGVELAVLRTFARSGRAGFHAENHFWLGLFGLIFWDEIFRPVPGAFGHPFQTGPADLFTDGFRAAREPGFSVRLAAVAADDRWKAEVLTRFATRHGTAHAMIWWDGLPAESFAAAVHRLDRAHVAAICDRLSRNPGGFGNGLPDLLVFGGSPHGYELVEVKGPGDRVQDNQRGWLTWLTRQGIPCRVLQVEYESGSGGS